MKKLFLLTLLITLVLNSFSQSHYVEYQVKNNNNLNIIYIICNDTITIGSLTDKTNLENPNYFIKNNLEDKVYSYDQFMNVRFSIVDTLYNMKWELTNDTATLLGKKCLSAITSFRGRKYLAFFSPEIQVNSGPWKFGGLPGLILKVKSEDNFIEWQAIKLILNYTRPFSIPKLNKNEFINWDSFVIKYKETVSKFIKLARSNGTISNDSEIDLKIDAVEIFYAELQTGNGIKF